VISWTARGLRVDGRVERLAVVPTGLLDQAPMAGRVEDGEFIPRFGFVPGTSYTVLDGDAVLGELVAPGLEPARVVAIHPDVDAVPVNLLKVYVEFDRPMTEGRVTVGPRDVFLEDLELWNRERTRLTCLVDPGRIKRGLVGRETAGYPLREGGELSVRVEGPALASAVRTYRVGPALTTRVDPDAWQVDRGTALTLRFGRPLDHALLEHAIEAPGTIEHGATWWRVTPAPDMVDVDTALEDVAGNSIRRVFDRDLTRREDDPLDDSHITLAFH
jgi:hypothetical protein